jgi:hypothetical protein
MCSLVTWTTRRRGPARIKTTQILIEMTKKMLMRMIKTKERRLKKDMIRK